MVTEGIRGSSLAPAVLQQRFDTLLAEGTSMDLLHTLCLAGEDVLKCSGIVP